VSLARCLERLARFAEVVAIDSNPTCATRHVAQWLGACVVDFRWDGRYPKKRDGFLRNDPSRQPRVLLLDDRLLQGKHAGCPRLTPCFMPS
jgi:hypothetical protein